MTHQRSRRRRAARSPAPPKDRHAAAAAEKAPRAPLLRGGDNVAEPLPGREPLPSRDTQLIESPHVWITEKAKVDAERRGIPSHLWCVHGKLYDLNKYMSKHPGGAAWLQVTRGSDVTDAYEIHHLNAKKTNAVLAKYYVRDAPIPSDQGLPTERFDWDDKGFYKTLQRRVFESLGPSEAARRAAPSMIRICWFLLLLWLALFSAMALAPTPWAFVAALAAGSVLHGLMGVGHNMFHQPDNWWMYTFDLTFFSSHHWRITHAISHHIYSNLELDTEVSSVEPFLYFLSNKPYGTPGVVHVMLHVLAAAVSTMDQVRHIVAVLRRRVGERLRPENVLPWLQIAVLVYSRPTWGQALGLFFAMQCTASYLLVILSFSVHRSDHAWTEGDPDATTDYGEHIMLSTSDHSSNISLLKSLWVYAGLSYHVMHHLFPTVDASRLQSLHPVLLQTCAEFGIKYRTHDFSKLWWSMWKRHTRSAPRRSE